MTSPHLSPYVRSGATFYFSGQLAFDAAGRIAGDDIEAQTKTTLSNISSALTSAGLSVGDIVKATAWLRDRSDFPGFNAAYAAFFGAHKPARSTVIGDLVLPEARVEIEIIASKAEVS